MRTIPEPAGPKSRARSRVKYALQTGRLKREPCIKCGKAKTQGHHFDYSKPLQVIWLCVQHHHHEHVGMRTHCKKGHPYNKENVSYRKDKTRCCRECNRASVRKEHYRLQAIATKMGITGREYRRSRGWK